MTTASGAKVQPADQVSGNQFSKCPNVQWILSSENFPISNGYGNVSSILQSKGCASDVNCPLDRPVCGAGFMIGGSGSGGGRLWKCCQNLFLDIIMMDSVIGGSGIEDPHACGCLTDSDCAGLTGI